MDPNLDEYTERLVTAWSKTYRKMQSEIMHHRELGLTGPQFQMLGLIYREGSCNVTYLSEALDVKPSAITVMTDRLIQHGYIERRHNEQDRRAVILSVTKQGEEVLGEARKKSRKVIKSYLSHLEPHELEILIGIIEKVGQAEKTEG